MRFRRGQGVPTPETALAFDYSPAELAYIEYTRPRSAIGDPQQVHDKIVARLEEFDVDEAILVTITHDFEDRVRSYELIAREFALDPREV